MIRRILPLAGIVIGLAALAPAAQAAQGGAVCTLDGNATLTPGLTHNTPAPPTGPNINWGPAFDYTFSGTLSNCNGYPNGGPKGGKITAGEQVTIGGFHYLTPVAHGNGGCTGSHTYGMSIITWDDGKISAVDYTTDGVAAAIGLQGNFKSGSITLTRVEKGPNGETVAATFPLAYGGDYAGGPLAFHPTDPQNCFPEGGGTGVKTAPITGAIGHGNYA